MRRRALIAVVLAGAAGLLAFVFIEIASVSREGVQVGLKQAAAECHEEAPACLPQITMTDTEGRAWSPEELAGKVVVVNFWATWCKPCLLEIPDLAGLRVAHPEEDLVLLGLLTDQPTEAQLDAFVDRKGINYPIVRAGPELLDAFTFEGRLPVTFVYDRTGHLRRRHLGILRRAEMGELLRELVAERSR